MSFLKLEDVNFSYDDDLITNFSLNLKEGEVHCFLGPSGSGKSTLLHLLAGFLNPSSGKISVDGEVIFRKLKGKGEEVNIPSEKRSIGVVFQEHCLFPHLSIENNIKFGMRDEEDSYVDELLSLVNLVNKKKCFPDELSGGEQQRIAIVRTLGTRPNILLMDEPFSFLGENLRRTLRREVINITRKLNLTTIIVTHSQEEAFEIADKITIIKKGRNYQSGEFSELLERPKNPFIVDFLNTGFFLKGLYNDKTRKIEVADNSYLVSNDISLKESQMAMIFIPFKSIYISNDLEGVLQVKVENRYNGRNGVTYELICKDVIGEKIQLSNGYINENLDLEQKIDLGIKKSKEWIIYPLK